MLAMETDEERRGRLENDAAIKRLRLAMETDKERRGRLENDAATKRLRLAMETVEERSRRLQLPNGSSWPWRQMRKEKQTGEESSDHTAQVGPGDRGRKKSKEITSISGCLLKQMKDWNICQITSISGWLQKEIL